MNERFNIFHLGIILTFACLFFATNILKAQTPLVDANIAGYLNKFRNNEYKESLDSIVSINVHKNIKENKKEYLVDYNNSILTIVSNGFKWDTTKKDWSLNRKSTMKFDDLDRIVYSEGYDLSSGKWVGYKKNIYSYYKDTQLKSFEENYEWNSTTANFFPYLRSEMIYNDWGKLIETQYFAWLENDNDWGYASKEQNFYNPEWDDKLDSTIFTNLNGQYNNTYYTYDKNGNNLVILTKNNYNSPSGAKIESQYDNKNRKTSSIESQLTSGTWVNTWKGNYEYLSSSELDNIYILQKWNNNEWNNTTKEISNYDDRGNRINLEVDRYDNTKKEWKHYSRSIFTFNDKNQNIKRCDSSEWDVQSEKWKWLKQESYEYDSYDNLLSFIDYYEIDMPDLMYLNSKYEYIYDYDKDTSTTFTPAFLRNYDSFSSYSPVSSLAYSKILTVNRYYSTSYSNEPPSPWELAYQDFFYYSQGPFSDVETPTSKQKSIIYPNPASNEITIASEDNIIGIEIYDVLGNLKLSHNHYLNPIDNKIDIQGMSSGVYVVKIICTNGTRNELLTIQR